MSSLIYINLVPSTERIAFEAKVRDVAARLKTDPNYLMQVMKSESGLSPSVRNTYAPFYKNGVLDGYATGLIQFTPDTARSLGTTTDNLARMTRLQQMDYVYKYLAGYTGKLPDYFSVYLVVFFPAAIGHTNDDNWIFQAPGISPQAVAKANPAIDVNKDGIVTMADFKQYVKNTVERQYWQTVFGNPYTVVGVILAMCLVFFCSLNF